jgi:hypothetical protein
MMIIYSLAFRFNSETDWFVLNAVWGFKILPPLCSSGQSSWLQKQRLRVRFRKVLHFLRGSVFESQPIQSCEDNWGANWVKKQWLVRSRKPRLTVVDTPCAGHLTYLHQQMLALTLVTSSGRSFSRVLLRTKRVGVDFVSPRDVIIPWRHLLCSYWNYPN